MIYVYIILVQYLGFAYLLGSWKCSCCVSAMIWEVFLCVIFLMVLFYNRICELSLVFMCLICSPFAVFRAKCTDFFLCFVAFVCPSWD